MANGQRFQIAKERLSDGSEAFGVAFCSDYDFDQRVMLECVDEKSANELIEVLSRTISDITVAA